MLIRNRKPTDDQQIYTLVKNAFAAMEQASGDEQNLVGRLRQSAGYVPELELIAEQDEIIVGHIMLTKIRIGNTEQLILAPLAVAPRPSRARNRRRVDSGGAHSRRTSGLFADCAGRASDVLSAFRLPPRKRIRIDMRPRNPARMLYGTRPDGQRREV